MKLLLDTNAYAASGRGHPAVVDLVRRAETLVFSTIVLGEVLAGFRHGSKWEENLTSLRRFLSEPRVRLMPTTWATADRYGRIYTALRRKGRPIPSNDMWIAAHTFETGAELISFDPHFEHVDGLIWTRPGG